MNLLKFKQALVSVSEKSGLVEFLRPLAAEGLKIISTGGTAEHLRRAGFEVIEISTYTGFPEVMDGRVKTLHPNVHMSLLSRVANAEDQKLLKQHRLEPIDLLIVNLYPFEKALSDGVSDDQQIEQIDIGGPSLLRGASKNFSRVTVLCHPQDYALCADGSSDLQTRRSLAAKAFAHVSSYDAMIATYLGADIGYPEWSLGGSLHSPLRYGENPQQQAAWYRTRGAKHGLHTTEIIQGKALSYNNLLDLDAAMQTVRLFTEPACVAVKHNNPCGVAVAPTCADAVTLALGSDPVSVFGGIIACNNALTEESAIVLSELFLECIIAPEFTSGALKVFSKKKNLRLLSWPGMKEWQPTMSVRSIAGGFLLQQPDEVLAWSKEWKVLGAKPSERLRKDLSLAWRVCARLKSNAIAVASGGFTLGLGMGQVNRVDAVELALQRWKKFHPQVKEAVLASDAFFPFADSIELLHKYGVNWVIQPGGSLRDEEVFHRAQDLGVNLIITGQRHFLH